MAWLRRVGCFVLLAAFLLLPAFFCLYRGGSPVAHQLMQVLLCLQNPAAVRYAGTAQSVALPLKNQGAWFRPPSAQGGMPAGNRPTPTPDNTATPLPSPLPATPSPQTSATPQPSQPPSPTVTRTPQPSPESEQEQNSSSSQTPPQGMLPIETRQFAQGWGNGFVQLEAGSIQNRTANSDAELREAARGGLPFKVEVDSPQPQVLILHTHATECYQPWEELYYQPDYAARSGDAALNMCAVGAAMAKVLGEAGINTVQDTTQHDAAGYTESYARSRATAQKWLEEYPSIQVVLDVHRDAIEVDNARIAPLAYLEEGTPTAQVMLICGCSNSGTVNLPHWRRNLQFAAAWETAMETQTPGLTRPILCDYRFYNQDLSTGALLLEVGGHGNTQAQALQGAKLAAEALAALLGGHS